MKNFEKTTPNNEALEKKQGENLVEKKSKEELELSKMEITEEKNTDKSISEKKISEIRGGITKDQEDYLARTENGELVYLEKIGKNKAESYKRAMENLGYSIEEIKDTQNKLAEILKNKGEDKFYSSVKYLELMSLSGLVKNVEEKGSTRVAKNLEIRAEQTRDKTLNPGKTEESLKNCMYGADGYEIVSKSSINKTIKNLGYSNGKKGFLGIGGSKLEDGLKVLTDDVENTFLTSELAEKYQKIKTEKEAKYKDMRGVKGAVSGTGKVGF